MTPEEFLRERKLSIATYFALALNFSYPVLEVLLFFVDPEEEVTFEKESQELKVKGRWINRLFGICETDYVFLFSEPKKVYLGLFDRLCDVHIASMSQDISIGNHSLIPKRGDPRVDFNKRWCVISPHKFYHVSEIPRL